MDVREKAVDAKKNLAGKKGLIRIAIGEDLVSQEEGEDD